jgi:hypothetical protein
VGNPVNWPRKLESASGKLAGHKRSETVGRGIAGATYPTHSPNGSLVQVRGNASASLTRQTVCDCCMERVARSVERPDVGCVEGLRATHIHGHILTRVKG